MPLPYIYKGGDSKGGGVGLTVSRRFLMNALQRKVSSQSTSTSLVPRAETSAEAVTVEVVLLLRARGEGRVSEVGE